jgi:pimeloyl-ACP methyl ester carboxylesterase
VRGEFLDVDEARLYYYAAGSRGAGEPIVLVHGFPTSSHLWRDVVPLLPAGHRVVVVDLLGFGRSDPAGKAPLTLAAHGRRIVKVLDQLGIEVACVVGHGIGGGIGQWLATETPRVSRLCLVASVAFKAWPTRRARIARALLPIARLLPANVVLSLIRPELMRGYADREVGQHDVDRFLRTCESENGFDSLLAQLAAMDASETMALAPRLPAMTQPTAIVWGEHDPFLRRDVGERLRDTIPGAELHVVPDASHFVPLDSPQSVASVIARLLAR